MPSWSIRFFAEFTLSEAEGLRMTKDAAWPEPERAALNVARLYQEFRGEI